MAPTIRLGSIFGIEIGANWSLIFVFALIAWTLATGVLPADVPHQASSAYWLAGAVGAIAFYGCLLAHELSHALTARRSGVKVAGITLWLFGGVSRLEGEPKSAAAEALIAGVGPLTSFVIARRRARPVPRHLGLAPWCPMCSLAGIRQRRAGRLQPCPRVSRLTVVACSARSSGGGRAPASGASTAPSASAACSPT